MEGAVRRSCAGTTSANGIGLAKELAEEIVTRAEAVGDASSSSRLVLVLDDYMYSAQVSLVQRKFRRLVEVFFACNNPQSPTRQTVTYELSNLDGVCIFLESLLRCHCDDESKLYLCLKGDDDPEVLFDKPTNNHFREEVLSYNRLSSWPVSQFRGCPNFVPEPADLRNRLEFLKGIIMCLFTHTVATD